MAIRYSVRWHDSETKIIYKATERSERLMSYLDSQLFDSELVIDSGDQPNSKRGYGNLIYYYKTHPRRQLLTAAPRREHNHIHVVLTSGILNRDELAVSNFRLGNNPEPNPDIMLESEVEIDNLLVLLRKNNYRL